LAKKSNLKAKIFQNITTYLFTNPKAETSLVESKNSLIRHYLARFNRKTKRDSKAMDMIENSLLLLFSQRNELLSTVV